jgi:hypothetical protein
MSSRMGTLSFSSRLCMAGERQGRSGEEDEAWVGKGGEGGEDWQPASHGTKRQPVLSVDLRVARQVLNHRHPSAPILGSVGSRARPGQKDPI